MSTSPASAVSTHVCEASFKDGNPCTYRAKMVTTQGVHVCLVHKNWTVQVDANLAKSSLKIVLPPVNAGVETIIPPMAWTSEPTITDQEGTMNIFYYLMCVQGMKFIDAVRVITNIPTELARNAVLESKVMNGRPIHVKTETTSSDYMYINGGQFHFPLLERAHKLGARFRISCFTHGYMKAIEPQEVLNMMSKANFFWADADQCFFVRFEGVPESYWGLAPFGINIRNGKKLQKRLKEVTRHTAYSHEGPFTMREFLLPEGDDIIFYDGNNAISPRLMKAMGFDGDRGNLRAEGGDFTLKGDCTKVHGLDVDIVYFGENAKPELSTIGGWNMATVDGRDSIHELRHDDQSTGNLPFFFDEEVIVADLDAMVQGFRKSVTEGGKLHNYLKDAQKAHGDPLNIDLGLFQMSQSIEEQVDILDSINVPEATFSNFTFNHINATAKKMASTEMRDKNNKLTGIYKGMFIPAQNALAAPVATWEFYTKMCQISFPGQDGTRTFYDKRFGLVIPGSRFRDTAKLHGGPDSDDHFGVYKLEVFCSDPARLANLRKFHVLDPALNIGTTAEEAVEAGLFIRTPNGPGEYSIEAIDPKMPFLLPNEDAVRTYDLADAPLCADEIFPEDFNFTGINKSITDWSNEFDRDTAMDMVFAQLENPGFGPFANVLMSWAQTFGDLHLPQVMIDRLENVVDCLQQTADLVAFRAIKEAIEGMWIEYRNTVIDTQTPVDPILLKTRVRTLIGTGQDAIPIGKAIKDAGLTAEGYHSRMQKRYKVAIKELTEIATILAHDTRNNLPMTKAIHEMRFGSEMATYADNWLSKTNGGLKEVSNQFKDEIDDANAILRRYLQVEKREAIEKYMDSVVDKLVNDKSVDTSRAILAVYKLITTPRVRHLKNGRNIPLPHGDIDRIIVQAGTKGHTSMLELFVAALVEYNLIPS